MEEKIDNKPCIIAENGLYNLCLKAKDKEFCFSGLSGFSLTRVNKIGDNKFIDKEID